MKKLICILMIVAMLLSFCACAGQNEETEPTDAPVTSVPNYEEVMAAYEEEKKEGQATPEEMYGMIDESKPVNGVYKIWSPKGVQAMADHPDATFEFLCSIDMEGATVRPIGTKDKPFTGKIRGQNTILSNLTITESADGYLGFIGYNKGQVNDLKIDGLTIVADANAKYIGGLAGYSETDLTRTTVNGSITVENAAEGALCGSLTGYCAADVINCVSDMDITYTASGAATIGGLVGVAEGSHMEFSEAYGFLTATGSNKTMGLVAGDAKDVSLYTVAFLGEDNSVDGKLCYDYFATAENAEYEKVLVRDNTPNPLPENQRALRDKVVEAMLKMATVEWTTTKNLYHDCQCQLAVCHGIYKAGQLHIGIPYNHYSTTYERFTACLDENNLVEDWVYELPSIEGFDTYFGNDCSGAVQTAWWTVSSTTDVRSCKLMQPVLERYGCIPVGEWPTDIEVPDGEKSRDLLIDSVDINVWFEAYAQVRAGDAYVSLGKDGDHTRMAQEDAVIVRDENGYIDGDYSYIITVEQGAPATMDPYFCSWRYDYKYTFKNLILGGYFPVTCIELATGETAPVECKMEGAAEGKAGLTLGTIYSNYNIDTVTMEIVDSQGTVAFKRTMNPNAGHRGDFGAFDMGIRNKSEVFELNRFVTPLREANLQLGESYNYTVTVLLSTGDQFVVHDGNFTHGTAQ